MKEKIMLHLEAFQIQNGEKEHVVTLDTVGEVYTSQGYLCLEYEETELVGVKGTTAQICIPEKSSQKVVVRRTGSSNMQQVFEEGKKHKSIYKTPYGEMAIEVMPRTVRVSLQEKEVNIILSYDLMVSEQYVGQHQMIIKADWA